MEELEIDDYVIRLANWLSIPGPQIYVDESGNIKGHDASSDKNRNVYCLDRSGNLVWQIESFSSYPGGYTTASCYYVGMSYFEDKLRLFNSCDLRVTVDYKTGKVLEKMYVR